MDRKNKESVWSNWEEFKACYQSLFQSKRLEKSCDINYDNLDLYINLLNFEDLISGLNILRINNIRNDNLSFILPTLLITEEIVRLKSGQFSLINNSDYAHILGQKLIRVVNIIVDNFKKKSKMNKCNMFLAASEINFPDFLIEIRHACTHKNLPSYLTLMYCIKYLFLWLKFNMWDKQNLIILDNEKFFNDAKRSIELLNSESEESYKEYLNKFEQLIIFKKHIKFEYSQLFSIIRMFFDCFIENCSITSLKKTVVNNKINEFISLYKLLQKVEKFKVTILFVKIVQEKISKYVQNILDRQITQKENEDNLQIYLFFFKFCINFIEEEILKIIDKNKYCQILRKIYVSFRYAKDFSSIIQEIYQIYTNFIIKKFMINLDYPQYDSFSNLFKYKQMSLQENFNIEDLTNWKSNFINADSIYHFPGSLITKQIKAMLGGCQESIEKEKQKTDLKETNPKPLDAGDTNTKKVTDEFINYTETNYIYFIKNQ